MPVDNSLVSIPLAAAAVRYSHKQFYKHHAKLAKQVHNLDTKVVQEDLKSTSEK